MKELIIKLKKISNQEDYFGKLPLINLVILLICCALAFQKDLTSVISSHLFILMWVSISSYQVFNLYQRKDCSFLFAVCNLPQRHIIGILLATSLWQSILFLPALILQLILTLNAPIMIAVLTGIVHFTFAITIGIVLSLLSPSHLIGLIADIVLFLFYFFTGTGWTTAELFSIVSPAVQIHNVYILDIPNFYGLITLTLLGWGLIGVTKHFSLRKKNIHSIVYFLVTVILFISAGYMPYYQNQKVFNIAYSQLEVEDLTLTYRGIDETSAIHYAHVFHDLEQAFRDNGLISSEIHHIEIQKYHAPIYLRTARRIPFIIKDDTLYINVFSNAMINQQDAPLIHEMFYRMSIQLISNQNPQLLKERNSYTLIYSTIYDAIKDKNYSTQLKDYSYYIVKRVTSQRS
ncbi:MAG: hypothetical protein E7231_12215 [Cellulosilyticum sp.]|nr:hypothetical protein [Cellulosilyticum sp.]